MTAAAALILLLALAALLLYALTKRTKEHRYIAALPMEGIRIRALLPPMLALVEKLKVAARFPIFFHKLQSSVQRGEGLRESAERTMLFLAQMLLYALLLVAFGCVMALLSGGSAMWLLIGAGLGVLLPAALIKDLAAKVKKREEQILMELPEMLNKIVLLVGAGETVQQALLRCSQQKEGSGHPLYKELERMVGEWRSGDPFHQAFEQFGKRCGVQESTVFVTTVLLNHKRGGGEFALALRDLSRTLWDKRKALGRIQGEKASSKLVFPMVLIFGVVLLMVGGPAMMLIQM
ncbi:type II secretion system F family protein [Saccharibacillus sp. CPCC 101409]|uniref:type II secretion system F family protein n=1 Tax=Saccharibacillus sp. CPCC 101409 TaxID=3058041 RepID=UPI002673BA5D|nr:type II secretion system F family protein [Saccharibacillus sp. CPCC 101409]MDO3408633.1 type II secretion system F family protein [Saccharibacillus sp. CPCC 101409]